MQARTSQYHKQATLEPMGTRPDYTFLLPNGLQLLHMDVKFPYNNYLRSTSRLRSESGADEVQPESNSCNDVKQAGQGSEPSLATSTQNTTVGYALAVHSRRERSTGSSMNTTSTVIDDAMGHRVVVLCSPYSLFAQLASGPPRP